MKSTYYGKLWGVYRRASTWEDFMKAISCGRPKWILLEAIEAGWENKIRKDLLERYNAPEAEVDILLHRYEDIASTDPSMVSAKELKEEMMLRVLKINILRGYLRYANYTAFDDPDDIIWTLDEELTELGSGTPTKEECASSYTIVTGKVASPGAVTLPGDIADKIATCLAVQIEELHKHLSPNNERRSEIISEMRELDEFHSALTGKSLLGSEFVQESLLKP